MLNWGIKSCLTAWWASFSLWNDSVNVHYGIFLLLLFASLHFFFVSQWGPPHLLFNPAAWPPPHSWSSLILLSFSLGPFHALPAITLEVKLLEGQAPTWDADPKSGACRGLWPWKCAWWCFLSKAGGRRTGVFPPRTSPALPLHGQSKVILANEFVFWRATLLIYLGQVV